MRVHFGVTAAGAGLVLAIGVTATHVPAGAATFTHQPGSGAAAIVAGTGHAAAHAVTVSQAIRAGHAAVQATAGAPLGRDGKPAGGALPARESLAHRARPAAAPTAATRANLGRPTRAAAREMRTQRAVCPLFSSSPSDFSGITEGGSDCTNCTTPDVSAAVSSTEIAETVNLSLQVYSKSTAATDCTVSLASLFGAVTALSHPRIQYDNANNRFSLLADSVPGSSGDVPIQYLAASQTSDACGAWWVYSLTFPYSSLYPFGVTLNYPYLGQDSTSILSSTNNYSYAGSYLGSAAYAMPKSAAYSGAGFSFTTYSVAFSTAPVTVAGIPTFSTTKTYWLAAVPGTGYDLYAMPTNPAGAISLQAVIKSSFTAPTRRVNQPGTSQTLDPLDGRIESAPVQDGSYVWFAHSVDDQGFPTIRYGAIDVSNDQITWGLAYHSSTSDDFNPSIGVTDAGGGTDYIWLNWAYTDTPNGVPVSDTAAGVAPGDGVPDMYGDDLTLVTGSSTGSITTFGGYSSTEIDPSGTSSCPAGLTALTAQEYFTSSGSWTTRLARTTFC
jgi:hypothetical protein